MKNKLLLLSFAICLFQIAKLHAQGGIDKPRYSIEIHRAGIYLGTIEIELFPLVAPLATNNFDSLVNALAYDSTAFHRVVPGFVIQGGDPNSINGPKSTWGYGNPNQPTVNAEFSVVRHLRSRIGAARSADTNSATSQFYICVAAALSLDGQYTVYGQVTSGMDVVDTIVTQPRDANDCPLQKIEMFITSNGVNDSIPDAPQLLSPPDNSTGVLNGQGYSWSYVSTAVLSTIEFSTDSLFTTIATKRNSGTTTTTIPSLEGYTTYYWRVKSNNGGHESAGSNIYKLTTATGPTELISPPDSSTNVFLNPIFVWDSTAGATSYRLQVAKNSVFTPGATVYDQSGITATTHQISGPLQTNLKHWWRVQSFDGTTPGNFSTKFSFTTGTSLGIENINGSSKNIAIKNIYPNPVKDKLGIDVSVKQPGTFLFTLKNTNGVVVLVSPKQITKHDYTTTIDVSKLSKGVYFLSVSADGEEVSAKVEVN